MKYKYNNICSSDGLEITKMSIIARIEEECPEILFSNLKPGQRKAIPWCCSKFIAMVLSNMNKSVVSFRKEIINES